MEEMIFNLADTHLFFNDLEVSVHYFKTQRFVNICLFLLVIIWLGNYFSLQRFNMETFRKICVV